MKSKYLQFGQFFLIHFLLCSKGNSQERKICERQPKGVTISKTPGDNGFKLEVVGIPESNKYTPGHAYTVRINGTFQGQRMLEFQLVSVPQNAKGETTTLGTYQHVNDLTKSDDRCPHIVTNSQSYRYGMNGVEVMWKAPPSGSGCVEFRAMVVQLSDVWYKDDGALTNVVCEETPWTEQDETKGTIPECCACGSAKYKVTFDGRWTIHTHPKDFPERKSLLHWSNIIGASHSRNYMIWQYGGYASRGVKELCEFAYTRTLEQEIKKHSTEVRTVIHAPGIWWAEPQGLNQERWARFSVNRKHHLLSLLTMLGPSPDWCVGVSALDLCLPNCTWAENIHVNLYPWDAGTDDGVTYLSPNIKTDPHKKIHKLSNTFPNDPKSPFFGPDPMKEVARLQLTRTDVTEKSGSCSSEHYPSIREIDDTQHKKGRCGVSDWGDWTECSVTCGVGFRVRRRQYLKVAVERAGCAVLLKQFEKCLGVENECTTTPQNTGPCGVTEWSQWSPCSVTCDHGNRERRRYYLSKVSSRLCRRNIKEVELCATNVDCVHQIQRDYTEICKLPRDVGPCRSGKRGLTRWYFNVTTKGCQPFAYGGCRGNKNNFYTLASCLRNCRLLIGKTKRTVTKLSTAREVTTIATVLHSHKPQSKVNCGVSSWSEWSTCSATCGKSFKIKRRQVETSPQNGGKKCPKHLIRRKKCKVPKCPRDCRLSSWGAWSECTHPCGEGSLQERIRQVKRYPKRGGKPCGPRMERRYCLQPACPPTV